MCSCSGGAARGGDRASADGGPGRFGAEERPLSEVVDSTLLGEVHTKKQVLAVLDIALGCSEADPELRPRMSVVAESLNLERGAVAGSGPRSAAKYNEAAINN